MRSPEHLTVPGFILDLDLCVGCHACVVACANENQLAPGRSWRSIVSFNPERLPGLRTYHLSLACNHCLDAPCMDGCPALAITRDEETGAVLLDSTRCIGCRYCSLVCPFDAPRFNEAGGFMEKCSFCNDRLLRGEQPACASMCPTEALSTGTYAGTPPLPVEGFPETRIRPSIAFTPMRGRVPQEPPPGVTLPGPAEYAAWAAGAMVPESKVSLRTEWPLALFSFVVIVLVAWFVGSVAAGVAVDPLIFGLAGVGALGVSGVHLGRKGRAWRAPLNWRRSWLSREILVVPLFVLLGAGTPLFPQASLILPWVGVAAGLCALIAIDRVYAGMARERNVPLDGAAALLSFAFLVAPAAYWLNAGQPWLPLLIIGAGELANRLEFYRAIVITTPGRAMVSALRSASVTPSLEPTS